MRKNFFDWKNVAKSKRCPKYGHFTVPGTVRYRYKYYDKTICKIPSNMEGIYEVHSRSKWKKQTKRERLQLERYIVFLNFPRHCCLHRYKTLKAAATVAIVVLYLPGAGLEKTRFFFFKTQPSWFFGFFLGFWGFFGFFGVFCPDERVLRVFFQFHEYL